MIGNSLVEILRAVGHDVISDNHIGDWGTQFGMVIYGYKHFVDQAAFQAAPVQELSRLYRLIQHLIGYQSAKSGLEAAKEKATKANNALHEASEAAKAAPADKKLAKNLKSAERSVKETHDNLAELQAKIDSVESDKDLLSLATSHPDLDQRVLKETALLHSGDATNIKLWEQFLPHCKAEMQTIYDRLGIVFDYELGESYYQDMLQPTVDGLLKSGAAQESQGAICVFLPGFDAPMIIQKQDGAFLYATTDLATVEYRMKQFHPDAILYVVDHRQSEPFPKAFPLSETIGDRQCRTQTR